MNDRSCSVIISVYNEETNLPTLYKELVAVASGEPALDWEFVFVDDSSRDRSLDILTALRVADNRVKIIRFSRNFGAHETTIAGLRACSGDLAIIMSADLQDPPQVIHEFLKRRRQSYEVVLGVRASRDDSWIRQISAWLFTGLLRRIALPSFPRRATGGFCLISRKVIDSYNQLSEKNRLTTAMLVWLGFTRAEVEYVRPKRRAGRSHWTFARQIKAGIDTILAFSYAPIRLMSLIGVLVAMLGLLGALTVVTQWLWSGTSVVGWASLLVCTLVLGGTQLLALGVLGEYLWRVLEETRQRPLYVVQDEYGEFTRVCGSTNQEQRNAA